MRKISGVKKDLNLRIKKAMFIASCIGLIPMTVTGCGKEEKSVYTTNVTDEKDVNIYNESGDVIATLTANDDVENIVITSEKPKNKNKQYESIIVSNDGELISGYIDGKDLNLKAVGEIEEFYSSDEKFNIGIVAGTAGVYARENKIVDRNTKNAELLAPYTYVLCGLPETSKDNAYTWRKILYFVNDEVKTAYMVDDYLLDIENLEKNRKFKVLTDLRLRNKPSTDDGEIALTLKPEDEIYIVPNVAGKEDEKYSWVQVAYCDPTTKSVELGWVAAIDKENNINYIEEVLVEEDVELEQLQNEVKISRRVDTTSANYADLKLREEPGTKAEILSKLEHGTTVYVTQNDINECENSDKINGFHWIKVTLKNGETGYVASDYLTEPDLSLEAEQNITYRNIQIYNEGKRDVVTGIDVAPESVGIGNFEEILKGNISISSNNGTGTIRNVGDKPDFVYIKLGATGYGKNFVIAGKDGNSKANLQARIDIAMSFANACEEYGVPYGFYYYSQAINEEETQKEIDYITAALHNTEGLKHHVLPLAVDIEELSGRMALHSSKSYKNKEELTSLKQKMMEELREKLGHEVIIYSDKNALQGIIDYSLLSDKNKEGIWLVDCSPTHSNALQKMEMVDDIAIRQVVLDTTIAPGVSIDVNIMNLEDFKQYTDKIPDAEYTFEKADDRTHEDR